MPARRPLEERFWEKVNTAGPTQPHMDTPCWVWTGSFDRYGYGHIITDDGTNQRAHRVGWVLQNGPIPEGHDVLHACDHPPCVRHLQTGTHQENMTDMVSRGRSATGERNGRHTKPERTARGKQNGRHTHPETTARGDRHGSRTSPEAVARGEKAGRAKLKDADVLTIRARFAAGETQSALAREFNLSSRNVCAIVRGESWKHLLKEGS